MSLRPASPQSAPCSNIAIPFFQVVSLPTCLTARNLMTKIVGQSESSALGEEKGCSALSTRNSFRKMSSMITINISMGQFVVTAGGFFHPLGMTSLPTSFLPKVRLTVEIANFRQKQASRWKSSQNKKC